jgi:hypothetical protein
MNTYRWGFVGNLKNVYCQFVLLFKHSLAQHVLHIVLMAIFWNKKQSYTLLNEILNIAQQLLHVIFTHIKNFYCVRIITLHFCTFSIMITFSYHLSKYTSSLTKTQHVVNALAPTSPSKFFCSTVIASFKRPHAGIRSSRDCHVITPAV